MDPEAFKQFWNDAPVFLIQGREHAVDHLFLENKIEDYLEGCVVTCLQLHRDLPISYVFSRINDVEFCLFFRSEKRNL